MLKWINERPQFNLTSLHAEESVRNCAWIHFYRFAHWFLCRCRSRLPPQGGDRSQHRQHDGHPERVADPSAEQLPLCGVEARRRNQVGERARARVRVCLTVSRCSRSTPRHRVSLVLVTGPSQTRRGRSTGTTCATSTSWSSGRQRWTPPGRSGPTTCWYVFRTPPPLRSADPESGVGCLVLPNVPPLPVLETNENPV